MLALGLKCVQSKIRSTASLPNTAPAPPTPPTTERQMRVVTPLWAATFNKRCVLIPGGLSPFDLWLRAVLRI